MPFIYYENKMYYEKLLKKYYHEKIVKINCRELFYHIKIISFETLHHRANFVR